jgi:hypothetical protein
MIAIYSAAILAVWFWASGFTGNFAESFSGASAFLVFWTAFSFFSRLSGARWQGWLDLLFFGTLLVCAIALHKAVAFQSNQEPVWRMWLLVPASIVMTAALVHRSYTLSRQFPR